MIIAVGNYLGHYFYLVDDGCRWEYMGCLQRGCDAIRVGETYNDLAIIAKLASVYQEKGKDLVYWDKEGQWEAHVPPYPPIPYSAFFIIFEAEEVDG